MDFGRNNFSFAYDGKNPFPYKYGVYGVSATVDPNNDNLVVGAPYNYDNVGNAPGEYEYKYFIDRKIRFHNS